VRSMVTVATRRPRRQPAMRPTQAHLLTLSLLPTRGTGHPPRENDLYRSSMQRHGGCMRGFLYPNHLDHCAVCITHAGSVRLGVFVIGVAGSSLWCSRLSAQCEQVRLSRLRGRLTSRPPRRHRHHRPHCQHHHVAALDGAARGAQRLAVVPTPPAQPALTRQARALSRTSAFSPYSYFKTINRSHAHNTHDKNKDDRRKNTSPAT